MKLHKKIPWEYQKQLYEIRILHDKNLINIVLFRNNYPANGFRYQIQLPKKTHIPNRDVYEHLIEYAKNDVIERRWEKLKKSKVTGE